MTFAELYGLIGQESADGHSARMLLSQTHWYTVNAEFDPKTGEALPQSLSAFLAKVADPKTVGVINDRLYRITEHARPSVKRLLHSLRESPRREQAVMPVHAVRELDASSFIKLSNRPGRTIREKLAGKPYLQAVRRYQSVNLPENRLLKAFVIRLAELLELRRDLLGEAEDHLIPRIHSWLRGDEAQAIARWENLPPNNTLLAHRDYRSVWDSWRRLHTLDEDIARDLSRLDERQETMTRWIDLGKTYGRGTHLFAEMPVMFGYEEFSIQTWLPKPLVKKAAGRITRTDARRTLTRPACIDLATLYPRFAVTEEDSETLADTYVWQQWRAPAETVEIILFGSDAVYLHPDANTIASPDLFFGRDNTSDHLDLAARAFVGRLSDTFKDEKLIWLVPDALNDFELPIIRRNLNARFRGAEPLPRSVAALFAQVDYTRITNDGYPVLVVDPLGGAICATKLIARFDADLKTRLPDTRGFYWERCPPVIITERVAREGLPYDMVTVNVDGEWRNRALAERQEFIDPQRLKADPRIGSFAFCINLSDSPVAGGMRLHNLQVHAGDIPLWRDQIPELSIKVIKDGRYQWFYLVSRGTTIKPIRDIGGQRIPISERFTLPAGKRFYQFPLFQGKNAAELRFSARLESPAFPLKANTECELILTFQYGDDEPYNLVFAPIDRSFPPVRATWQRTVEAVVTDAPAPVYPEPLSWDALRRWRDAQGNEVDLLAWLIDSLDRLCELIPERCLITVNSPWKKKTDNDGNVYWFAFAVTNEGEKCYCNSKSLAAPTEEDPNPELPRGTNLYAEIRRQRGGAAAFDISREQEVDYSIDAKRRIVSFRERSLQNRMSTIWADGRSLNDAGCPVEFRKEIEELFEEILEFLPSDIISRKMMFLFSCLHKDAPDVCVRWISDQVKGGRIHDPRAIGFALGDVSQEWQQEIFDILVSHPKNDAISVFAYSIWRERRFIDRFSPAQLKVLLNSLSMRLASVGVAKAADRRGNDKWARRKWAREIAEPLELLLGLLRTRVSDDPENRMLLQPHQKITKRLAEQVDRIEGIVAESNRTLFSRVQIDVRKPAGIRTPDLLYALRLYLTGDDGANAIHITGVSDTDDD